MRLLKSALLATAAMICAAPAFAQKAQDTIRVAINNPFVALSSYNLPLDEASVFYSEVYERLVYFDERTQKYVPALAKSWKRIDNRTIELPRRQPHVIFRTDLARVRQGLRPGIGKPETHPLFDEMRFVQVLREAEHPS